MISYFYEIMILSSGGKKALKFQTDMKTKCKISCFSKPLFVSVSPPAGQRRSLHCQRLQHCRSLHRLSVCQVCCRVLILFTSLTNLDKLQQAASFKDHKLQVMLTADNFYISILEFQPFIGIRWKYISSFLKLATDRNFCQCYIILGKHINIICTKYSKVHLVGVFL